MSGGRIAARIFIGPWQRGHSSTSTPNTRCISSAQGYGRRSRQRRGVAGSAARAGASPPVGADSVGASSERLPAGGSGTTRARSRAPGASKFKVTVAIPSITLYAQFGKDVHPGQVLKALAEKRNRHDRDLPPEFGTPPYPAGSSKACNDANKSCCSIFGNCP